MARAYLTPAALLLGSCIIGAGLYFGLARRADEHQRGDATPPAQSAQAETPASAPPPHQRVKQVTVTATAALAALKPALIEACWKPAVAANPEPASAQWTLDATFNTEGVEIARGISDVRGRERSDVAECLRQQPLDLRVPPPAANTRVTLQLDLP